MVPPMSERNLTPTSVDWESYEITCGVVAGLKTVKPWVTTVMLIPAAGVSRLPLSSTARLRMP